MKQYISSHLKYLCLFCTLFVLQTGIAQDFITTWDASLGNGDGTITIPTDPNSTYRYDVDCGCDGSLEASAATGDVTLTLGKTQKQVCIRGNFPRIYFNNQGDKLKITQINQWGNIAWTSMYSAFFGCENLQCSTKDAPDLSRVKSMRFMFKDAKILNANFLKWDVSNVTNMNGLFQRAHAFNGNVSTWDVSNVEDMSFLFAKTYAFNQNVSMWNVSSVKSMHGMFWDARVFNQDLSTWDVGNVEVMSHMFQADRTTGSDFNGDISTWDVGNVKEMHSMFYGANTFNSDLSEWKVGNVEEMTAMFRDASVFNQDIREWNVSNVKDMTLMFKGAAAFNQNLGAWSIGNVTSMVNMLDYCGMVPTNYDLTLMGWSAFSGKTLGAKDLEYCLAATQHAAMEQSNWMFVGDSLKDGCP